MRCRRRCAVNPIGRATTAAPLNKSLEVWEDNDSGLQGLGLVLDGPFCLRFRFTASFFAAFLRGVGNGRACDMHSPLARARPLPSEKKKGFPCGKAQRVELTLRLEVSGPVWVRSAFDEHVSCLVGNGPIRTPQSLLRLDERVVGVWEELLDDRDMRMARIRRMRVNDDLGVEKDGLG